ncbi:Yap1802p KNAG_0K00590 [Huiozyma naganishii CBS 8797]|uniref:ENTH domain-containing protein n=1 Tax=Huiozyma naganishii (strain ATCC MYA-139 / BCRC 22969 / CBS 8797 / KCTC 17520 / NBRC 10181 / NCYC 3082 / Yp74L-3) TaxID=1071383 RepID=J7S354_HUIN7|nr:hypothetical protein KNAG_0K00590 [Kazachstania naganishii CBS 8797]CCK72427.1 hypothetical protein KNAG_0K00590 [Kazachstania naganishii CBS 8797]
MLTHVGNSYTKMVKGATKIKMAPPKAKYVDPILQGMSDQRNFNEIVDALQDRMQLNIWSVVYKSLIVIHLMVSTHPYTLEWFADHAQSVFHMHKIVNSNKWSANDLRALQRYNDYLRAKCIAYGETRRGSKSGNRTQAKLREVESLLDQIRALLKNRYSPQDLDNELLLYAFKLLTKDLLELYNKLNADVIVLLESFFDLSLDDAERTLDNYKVFVDVTEYVVKFLKVGKAVGLDIPVIKHITTKLIRSLEQHLDSLAARDSDTTPQRQSVPTAKSRGDTEDDVAHREREAQAREQLAQIREQKRQLEQQLQQQQSVMITPTVPQYTGTNPFSPSPVIAAQQESFSFEPPVNTGPILQQNTNNPFLAMPTTGTGLSQPPYQRTGSSYVNNPFTLSNIIEEPTQEQQAPVQVTGYYIPTNQPPQQHQAQYTNPFQQPSQPPTAGNTGSNLVDM